MSANSRRPRRPLLKVRVDVLDRWPSLTTLCAGYEADQWRGSQLVRDVFDRHLISFASKFSVVNTVTADSAAVDLRNAAKIVYETDRYSKRGEYGELLLHSVLRDLYGSEVAVSKIYFKDGPNETVKGYDAVHVSFTDQKLELWLGEVKFYAKLYDAIYDVSKEIEEHLGEHYLRGEFISIGNKIDPEWTHADRLSALIDVNTSLDEIFDSICIPVLLTYESDTIGKHHRVDDDYIAQLSAEAEYAWNTFAPKMEFARGIQVRLILLPIDSKQKLVDLFHQKLKLWQQI